MPDTHSLGSPTETKPPFSQPLPEKFDAEALRDWEDEGGAQSPLKTRAGSLMKALTYLGPGRRALEAKPKPTL